MCEFNQEYLNKILATIAEENNIKDWKCSVEKFDVIAQNYFGVLIPIILTGNIGGDEVSLKLVLKLAPNDERFRVSGAITLMFAREIFVYSTLINEYMKLQEHFRHRYLAPKCYFTRSEFCHEAIVLQDMRDEGFNPYADKTFLDLEHVKLSLQSLGQLHALSFIVKEKKPNLYGEAEQVCVPLNNVTNKRFIEILKDRLSKALIKFNGTKYSSLFENLIQNCNKIVEAIATEVSATAICHGDMWKENILFKYEDKKPTSACIIDYQTMRMSSPAFDVLYLITTSTDANLRKDNFQNLLDTYYESLVDMLNQADIDPIRVYPKEFFEQDLKTVSSACFIIANTALWLFHGLQEEGHVRSKKTFDNEEQKMQAVEDYKGVMKNIADDFCSYGYFSF